MSPRTSATRETQTSSFLPALGVIGSNETKMSDGGRGCASLEVNGWKSSQKSGAQRSDVRSIAWLDDWVGSPETLAKSSRARLIAVSSVSVSEDAEISDQ